MAHIKQVSGRSYPHIYNVDQAVGSLKTKKWGFDPDSGGGQEYDATKLMPNKRDDVMLVQYMLRRVYQKAQNTIPQLNPAAGSAWGDAHGSSITELKIDGCYGPKTQKAITHFQFEVKRNGGVIATDGCVDSEKGAISSISQTGYTINFLNKYFWQLYPSLAPNIVSDPECPAELKQALGQGALV